MLNINCYATIEKGLRKFIQDPFLIKTSKNIGNKESQL